MQRDVTQKMLEDCNDVFADIYNAAVFGGREILKEEDLISLPTESFTKNTDGTVRQGFRDVRKADKRNGRYRLICGIENQDGVDNTMSERIMGYEYASYEEQIRALMAKNKKEKKPAVIRRIHDEQKLSPVVTAVMNWGDKEWSGPRSLHDMLEFSAETESVLRPLVADYPLHLIEMAKLPEEVRKRFQSDFRILAEYMACREDPEKWVTYLQANEQEICHPEELMDALYAVAGDKRFGELRDAVVLSVEKGEMTMRCKAMDLLDKRGISKLIETCREIGAGKDITLRKVMEKYSLTREEAEQEMERYWK